jgi:hypothetical protein
MFMFIFEVYSRAPDKEWRREEEFTARTYFAF